MDPELNPTETENAAEAQHPLEPVMEHSLLQADQNHQEAQMTREHAVSATAENTDAIKALEPILEHSLMVQDGIKTAMEKKPEPIVSMEETAQDIPQIIFKGMRGPKGDPGVDAPPPTDEYLLGLIKPLIPAPIKGDTGEQGGTPSDEELIDLIRPLIPAPIPGHTPTEEELLAIIIPLIPELPKKGDRGERGLKGADGSPDSGEDIVKKLLELDNEQRTPLVNFLGIPKYKGKGGAGYLKELSDVSIANITNGQTLVWDSTTNTFIPGTSSGGSLSVSDTSTINLTYSAGVLSADVISQMSVISDASGLKLSGDASNPGNSKYYGTDSGGTKGWFALPTAGAVSWGDITGTLSAQTDLQTALDAKLTKNGAITGATKTKITYDANGLVTAGADATTSDIAEGSRLYYTDARVRANSLDQMTAPASDVSMNSHKITSVTDPVSAQDAATKGYVDAVAQGLSPKGSVLLATAAALPTNTYLTNVITITATGTLTIDGTVVALNDRVLVKDEVSQLKNGIYKVTTAGAIGVAAVLTRSTDMDISAEFPGAFCFVESGTVNTAAGFVCTNSTPPTVGTTAITFTQFSGAGEITAGNGLSKSANTLSIDTSITADLTTVQAMSNKTLTSPVLNGTMSGTGVASAATASTLMLRDSNGNVVVNNIVEGFTTTATAAGTTTMTIASTFLQFWTGATTQTVKLPTTSVLAGQQYLIVNNSTGAVTVQSSGANTIVILAASTSCLFTALIATPTTAANWDFQYSAVKAASGKSGSFSNTLVLAGTDGTTMTFPSTSATIARTDAANTFTGVQTMTSPALTTPAITGIATGSGVATAATVSTLALRDTNGNLLAVNFIEGFTTTATAAGTTTMTVTSTYIQYWTGATTQTVKLPTTSIVAGQQYLIVNKSSGAVTVQSSGANTIVILAANTSALFTALVATPTTAANWDFAYNATIVTSAKSLSVSNTLTLAGTDGTTMTFPTTSKTIAANDGSNLTIASQAIGDLLTATSTTAYGRLAAVATGSVLVSSGTGTAPAWSSAPQVTSIELGNATDTTLARVAAGIISVEGEVLNGYATTATAAGTTTLAITAKRTQYFTGSSTQTVKLPTTSVILGQSYVIKNLSTGSVTVQSSGANTIVVLGAGMSATFVALAATPTTAANWDFTQVSALGMNIAQTASANAATVNIAYVSNTITNNSAATITVTIPTAGAVDGEIRVVRVLDFSAAAQTLTWVNTENSTATAPVLTNGSTTLPISACFQYNAATSKWRCTASA